MRPAPQLRRIREERFLTQDELAKQVKMTRATIYRIEKGEPARLTTLRKLAEALGVTPAELVAPERPDQGQTKAAA